MKIAMISDAHTYWDTITVPECDLLISAGDYSNRGEPQSIVRFHEWMSRQPARHKISVQGNHEVRVQMAYELMRRAVQGIDPDIHFVEEGLIAIEDVRIWCSAFTPRFFDWAYLEDRGPSIAKHWERIPDDVDVLVTHGPPHGILDTVKEGWPDHLGCVDLMYRVKQLKNLKLHVFGHIHGGSGERLVDGVQFVNAAVCNERYAPVNPVRVFDLEDF